MTNNVFSWVAGLGIGAAAMYLLDPQMGERRRALARDRMTETRKKVRNAAGITARDLSNRSAGIIAEACSGFSEGEVSDEILAGRVRSKLGFLVRHPSAITAEVSNGRVILSGPVLSDEVRQLVKGIRAVRGVTDVEDRLTVHDDPAQVPGRQSDKPKPAGEVWDIMQRHWSPATRFLVGTAGAVSLGLVAYSLSDGSRQPPGLRQKTARRKERTGQEEINAGWGA